MSLARTNEIHNELEKNKEEGFPEGNAGRNTTHETAGEPSSIPDPLSASRSGTSSVTSESASHTSEDEWESPITLETIHATALEQLKEMGLLSPLDYARVEGVNHLQDILGTVDETVSQNIKLHSTAEKVRRVLKSLLERIDKFESAIDKLARRSITQAFGVSLLGIIWGSLKVFLVVVRDNADTIDAVVRLLDGVLKGTIDHLDNYLKVDGASLNKLPEQPLVDLYAKLIAFGIQAAKCFSSSTQSWSSLQDFGRLIDEVREVDHRVSNLIWIEYSRYTGIGHRTYTAGVEINECDEIREWLLFPDGSQSRNAIWDVSLTHNTICSKRRTDTGSWFIKGESFRKWKEHAKSILWLQAIPGGGKTILCSTVIDDVRASCQYNPSSRLAYFYFTDKSEVEDVILSVISQLSAKDIPRALKRFHDHYRYEESRHPSMKALKTIIPTIIKGFRHVYLILDALDECSKRRELLRWLEELISAKLDGLHLLITSRAEKDIRDRLEPLIPDVIDIGNEVGSDIQIYLRETLRTDPRFTQHNWPEEVQEKIRTTLMDRAMGMFRWVALQLNSLECCRMPEDVYECLESLPEGLDEAYDRILMKIQGRDSKWAFKALQCLAFSARQMTLEEVADVIAFNPDSGLRDEKLPNPLAILDICSSLVTISSGGVDPTDRLKGVLTLSHFTVKEYLISQRIRDRKTSAYGFDEETAHRFMCRSLLGYLMQFDKSDSLDPDNVTTFPLAIYAAEFWTHHAKAMGTGAQDAQKAILRLLQPQSDTYINWIRIYDANHPMLAGLARRLHGVPSGPLYYVSLAGLEEIAQALLENESNVNAEGGKHGSALQAASLGGHEAVVRLLLENGANINAGRGEHGSALQAASFRGHEAVVRLLLDNGANINAKEGWYGTALYAASLEGHKAIVRLLLENKANVNYEEGQFGSALQAASLGGHEAVVRLLLENEANVNAEEGDCGSALQIASMQGLDAIVRLLLENGADVNAENGHFGSALQAASFGGHEAIVRLLLENEADINAEVGNFESALQAASVQGHEVVVRLLLENGANVDAGRESGRALQAASTQGHEAIVRLLLENGANVNAQGKYFESALYAASSMGYDAIVRVLLENGANVNAGGGSYGNSLQVASFGGHNAVVQLLLKNEANVNAEGGLYGSALEAASMEGHEAVVRLLLKNGANVNAGGGKYGSALQAASYRGHKAIVRLLLQNGAN